MRGCLLCLPPALVWVWSCLVCSGVLSGLSYPYLCTSSLSLSLSPSASSTSSYLALG